jgi:hypothetical protein
LSETVPSKPQLTSSIFAIFHQSSHALQLNLHINSITQHERFAWLISHQPTVLFSQNKPATSNQPEPASSTLLSEQTSHQPTEQAAS